MQGRDELTLILKSACGSCGVHTGRQQRLNSCLKFRAALHALSEFCLPGRSCVVSARLWTMLSGVGRLSVTLGAGLTMRLLDRGNVGRSFTLGKCRCAPAPHDAH